MTKNQDHARIRYLIRRKPRQDDDTKLALDAQKIIRKVLGKNIVPFNLAQTGRISISNTGLSIQVDNHDLNSWRIDVNVLEPDCTDVRDTFFDLAMLAIACKDELQKLSSPVTIRCFLSIEITG